MTVFMSPEHCMAIKRKDDAIALSNTGWWKLHPARDVALAQLRQPLLCMPFAEFQRMTEEALGEPVWTHEFANPEALIQRIEAGHKGQVNPMRSLADVMLRRTRSGLWAVKGRRYRTKALAMRSLNVVCVLHS